MGSGFAAHQKEKFMKTRSNGFTLIEVLLVVVIIGSLAAMVIPRLAGRGQKARVTIAQVDIDANIASALKLYELDNGLFPTTDQGLKALLQRPVSAPAPIHWSGPYLEKEPLDPWGRPYQYRSPGSSGRAYDLYSFGQDEANQDAWIKNWG